MKKKLKKAQAGYKQPAPQGSTTTGFLSQNAALSGSALQLHQMLNPSTPQNQNAPAAGVSTPTAEQKQQSFWDQPLTLNWSHILGSQVIQGVGSALSNGSANSYQNATLRYNQEVAPTSWLPQNPNSSLQAFYGEMQQGGVINIDSTLTANKTIPFVDRILNAPKYPVRKNKDGTVSTHLMGTASDDTGPFAYPTLRLVNGKWVENPNPKDAIKSGDIIRFKTDAEAEYFANNYKNSPLSKIKKQKGGVVDNFVRDFLFDEGDAPKAETPKAKGKGYPEPQRVTQDDAEEMVFDYEDLEALSSNPRGSHLNKLMNLAASANSKGANLNDIDPNVMQATNELLQKFPNLKITSGRRNWGDKDAHPKGRAVDLAGPDMQSAYDYYKNTLVPKYGFNPALPINHGTGPHIHLGYYQQGGKTTVDYSKYQAKPGYDMTLQKVPKELDDAIKAWEKVKTIEDVKRLETIYTKYKVPRDPKTGGWVFKQIEEASAPQSGTHQQLDVKMGPHQNAPIYTDNPNDPRIKKYQDSLSLYKRGLQEKINYENYVDALGIKKDNFVSYVGKMYRNASGPIKPIKNTWVDDTGLSAGVDKATMHHYYSNNSPTDVQVNDDIHNKLEQGYNLYKKPVQPVVYKKPEVPVHMAQRRNYIGDEVLNHRDNLQLPSNVSRQSIDFSQKETPFAYQYRDENGQQAVKYLPDLDTFKAFVATQPLIAGNGNWSAKGAQATGHYLKLQQGGSTRPPIYTDNPKDPRIRSYQDSLQLYNQGQMLHDMMAKSNLYYPTSEKNPITKSINNGTFTVPSPLNPLGYHQSTPDFGYNVISNGPNKITIHQNNKIQPIQGETFTRRESMYPTEAAYDKAALSLKSLNEKSGKANWLGYENQLYKKPVQPVLYQAPPAHMAERRNYIPLEGDNHQFQAPVANPRAPMDFTPKQTPYAYQYRDEAEQQQSVYLPDYKSFRSLVDKQPLIAGTGDWSPNSKGAQATGHYLKLKEGGEMHLGGSNHGQMTSAMAKKILKDGKVEGHPLTARQKHYFKHIAAGKVGFKDGEAYMKKQEGGIINTTGYTEGTETADNPMNIIPSGDITMAQVYSPVIAIPVKGNKKGDPIVMKPGTDYAFDADYTMEFKAGGEYDLPNEHIELLRKLGYDVEIL